MNKTIKMCRLCLNKTQISFDLLTNEENVRMLEALTRIKVEETDGISTVMCLKCRLNLRLAYHIQQRMMNAEKKFKERITTIMIKDEQMQAEEMIIKNENNDEIISCQYCGKNCDNNKCRRRFKRCGKCHRSILLSKYKNHMLRHNSLQSVNKLKFQGEKRKYVCQFCDKSFLKLSLRDSHIESEHQSMEYFCQICGKKFSSKTTQRVHEYNHRRKACPICNKLVSISNIEAHIETHKDVSVMCDLCGVTLKNKNNLKQHNFYKHNDSRYKCEHCERVFKKKQRRDLHVRKEHLRQADFVCETCGRKFYSVVSLNVHVKKIHLRVVSYPCEFCKRGFSSSNALRTHRRQHTNETPYKCEICAEGFRQKVSLKWHRKSKHGIVEAIIANCEICGKGFSTKTGLETHTRVHD